MDHSDELITTTAPKYRPRTYSTCSSVSRRGHADGRVGGCRLTPGFIGLAVARTGRRGTEGRRREHRELEPAPSVIWLVLARFDVRGLFLDLLSVVKIQSTVLVSNFPSKGFKLCERMSTVHTELMQVVGIWGNRAVQQWTSRHFCFGCAYRNSAGVSRTRPEPSCALSQCPLPFSW